MTIVSNLDLIHRVPLFSDLTSTQTSVLYANIGKKRFKRGENIVEEGRISGTLYMILSGRARVLLQDHRGREVIMATLEVGDCIGEMSLIDGEPHSATVRAEVQTDVLTLDREAFLNSLRENSSMAESVMRGLVRRLRKADKQIESLALMDVYGRVARLLLEMAEKGEEIDGKTVVRKITKQDIARMIGASREMVSRVMKDLSNQGLINETENGIELMSQRLGEI